jgi:hypothetical protein
VPAFTVRYNPIPTDDARSSLADFARRNGATVSSRDDAELDRTYALIEGASAGSFEGRGGATVFETPVIALAIRPNVAEALPAIQDALGGPGRPSGVVSCELAAGAIVIEWNLERTPADVVLAAVDVELARFGAARVSELLTPLPLAWWTSIASAGLSAPEIAPDRVLEALIEEHHVAP